MIPHNQDLTWGGLSKTRLLTLHIPVSLTSLSIFSSMEKGPFRPQDPGPWLPEHHTVLLQLKCVSVHTAATGHLATISSHPLPSGTWAECRSFHPCFSLSYIPVHSQVQPRCSGFIPQTHLNFILANALLVRYQ